jgi:hypothetical protein
VATGMYWWCVSFRNYVYALRYVDSLANGGSIFQDCNNNCVVQTKRVAFYAGVTLNYSGIECDNPGGLSAYLNDLLPSPPPCSCQ